MCFWHAPVNVDRNPIRSRTPESMKQSLLAFLAMSIFSLLALSQQRVMMRHHSIVYGRDAELAAMNMVSDPNRARIKKSGGAGQLPEVEGPLNRVNVNPAGARSTVIH